MLHRRTLATQKIFFPIDSTLVAILWGLVASLRRILAIIGFFGPFLGLFNILFHWVAEQYPFTMRKKYHPLPFDNITLFNMTEKLKWRDYDRASYELPLDPAPAPYTLYTGFDLQHSVALFLVFMTFNMAAMGLVKHFTSEEFSRDCNWYNKIVHILQCTNISFPYVDWDQGQGSVEEFKLRYSNTEREMAWSFVVNSFFSLASMVLIVYTGLYLHSAKTKQK